MVSATNLSPSQSLLLGQSEGMMGLPETEGFDFMSYLLGLQAGTNTDSALPDSTSLDGAIVLTPKRDLPVETGEITVSPEEKTKEKELSQWNPIFPGITPVESRPIELEKTPIAKESKEVTYSGTPNLGMTPAMFQWSSSKGNVESLHATQEKPSIKAPEVVMTSAKQVAQKYTALQAPQNTVEPEVSKMPTREQVEEPVVSKVSVKPELVVTEKTSKKRDHVSSLDNPFTLMTPMEDSQKVQVVESPVIQPNEAKPTSASTVPELFQNVETMIRTGGGKMTVHLSPPELGDVQIQVTARGKNVEVEMTSDNDQTKSILENGLNDLKSSMHSLDLVLHKMEVHVNRETSLMGEGQFAAFTQGQPQQSFTQGSMDQRQQQNQGRSFAPGVNQSTLSRVTAPVSAFRPMAASSRGVDIRI